MKHCKLSACSLTILGGSNLVSSLLGVYFQRFDALSERANLGVDLCKFLLEIALEYFKSRLLADLGLRHPLAVIQAQLQNRVEEASSRT